MFPNSQNGDGPFQSFMKYASVNGQQPRTNLSQYGQYRIQSELHAPQLSMDQTIQSNHVKKVAAMGNGQPRDSLGVINKTGGIVVPRRAVYIAPSFSLVSPYNNQCPTSSTVNGSHPQKRKSPLTNQPKSLQKPANNSNRKCEPVAKIAKVANIPINKDVYIADNTNSGSTDKSLKIWYPKCSAASTSNTNKSSSRTFLTKLSNGKPGTESTHNHRLTPASTSEKDEDKNFDPKMLSQQLRPVWESLFNSEMSMPFRSAVDTNLLNCPDYYDVVQHPIDLSIIRDKLNKGIYLNPWQFCDDIWLLLHNAWLYNRKTSKVYKQTTKLSELFMEEMDPLMQDLGYCCSRNLSFTQYALLCYGPGVCTVARDQTYMIYEQPPSKFEPAGSKLLYCMKCFDELPSSNAIPKEKFIQKKNNVIYDEPFEKCKSCHRKWHSICALFHKDVFPDGFTCDGCRVRLFEPRLKSNSTARKLPHNKLSRCLENRVNKFINSKSWRYSEKNEVIIRTLCVQDKEFEVKPLMKERFASEGFPDRFPYRTKAVFAFEVIDGMEVCFFGMHVQEYGSNVPSPNQRCVYISYLDSVQLFQPRELRTDVYHEIILGYLDYVRGLGYATAHIWACPPGEGDDYIFHCHPPEQKMPKSKRLQSWYKIMLDKGIRECSISEYKDIYQQAKDDQLFSPAKLPYFKGDFWPNVIEDCIRETNEEEMNRKRLEGSNDAEVFAGDSESRKNSVKNKKNKNGMITHKKQTSVTGNLLLDKLYSLLDKNKDIFFTVHLMAPKSEHSLKEIVDPDPIMSCDLMDGRETFLTRARNEHWEFSSLRRAKYSTLVWCHALHEHSRLTCNKCSETAYHHCTVCEDYDLCNACFKQEQHPHTMDRIKPVTKIEDCFASLYHSCQCHNTACTEVNCNKMKKVVKHTKLCKKSKNDCYWCKQLISLCCFHSKMCKRDHCPVPFCVNLRQKFTEQMLSASHRSDMMMRRRMGAIGVEDEVLQQNEEPSA